MVVCMQLRVFDKSIPGSHTCSFSNKCITGQCASFRTCEISAELPDCAARAVRFLAQLTPVQINS